MRACNESSLSLSVVSWSWRSQPLFFVVLSFFHAKPSEKEKRPNTETVKGGEGRRDDVERAGGKQQTTGLSDAAPTRPNGFHPTPNPKSNYATSSPICSGLCV